MDDLDTVLAKIFEYDTEIYNRRGFRRRVGYGVKPALLVIDMANGWTQRGSPFACDGMNSVIPAIRDLLDAFTGASLGCQRSGAARAPDDVEAALETGDDLREWRGSLSTRKFSRSVHETALPQDSIAQLM
jgi:hypothetical protein